VRFRGRSSLKLVGTSLPVRFAGPTRSRDARPSTAVLRSGTTIHVAGSHESPSNRAPTRGDDAAMSGILLEFGAAEQ
jgi:hypothetical protein